MNLFKIDFIQGKTDAVDYNQVKHSLVDYEGERAIMSLSLSADKLQSESNYAREPKRLEFECWMDDWIENNIMIGTYEHERYISHYEVKAWRDGVQIFAGIIDTSALNYNVTTGVIKFLCYDKIKLLSVYGDLEQLYTLSAGYQPAQILGYFLQKIQQRMPIGITVGYSGFSIPQDVVSGSLVLGGIGYSEMLVLPSGGGYTYSWTGDSWITPHHGFAVDTGANRVIWVFAHKKYVKAYDPSGNLATQYQARYMARIYVYYSGLSFVQYDYSDTTDWQGNLFGPTSESDIAFRKFFSDCGFSEDIHDNLITPATLHSISYISEIENEACEVATEGNDFPSYLHPGGMYDPTARDEKTNCLKTLQAVLMLYNATIVATPSGQIQLVSKSPGSGTAIEIADADVVGDIEVRRINNEIPDTTALEVLYGNTKYLKEICKGYSMAYLSGKWEVAVHIDQVDKYAIGLGSLVIAGSKLINVTEVTRDYAADELVIRGWQ